MRLLQRCAGVFILLTLFATLASAQDNTPVTVVGSGVVNPVFDALKNASGVAVEVNSSVTGTRSGFDAFCKGQADVANANRSISADENTNCTTNNVDYLELLIAYNVIAVIAPPDAAYAQCLTLSDLNAAFAPSAQTTNWNQVNSQNADTPLTLFVPNSTSTTFSVLDKLVEGDGIRADASTQNSDSDVVASVVKTPGSVGVVSLPVATAAGSTVKIAQINANDTVGCASPSAENVEQRLYTAADEFFVYVNRAALSKSGLKDLLAFAVSDKAPTVIDGLGFTAPVSAIYDTNRKALEGTGNTHAFSEATAAFSIPADVNGQVTVAGASSGRDYISGLASGLQAQYASLTVDIKTTGQPAGIRRLCNGEIDIAIVEAPLTAEQQQNCDANNISTFNIELGKQVVVLVANANSAFLACLTPQQLNTTWNAASAKTITNWNQVDPSFPDQKMTLFAPKTVSSAADIMMVKVAGSDIPSRDDTAMTDDTHADDPLYRAAAAANVEGSLTYMTWQDYQKVVDKKQDRIQLVSVNSGNGCVAPTLETIADGSYVLTRSAQLLVNRASLTKVQVQSFLWFLASDDNYSALEGAGFVGVGFGSLPGLRQSLQKAYVDAAVAATQAAEATPEATAAQ